MQVGVSYALKEKQTWLQVQVPEGSTVEDAINASGILDIFSDINLSVQKVGVFGKVTKLQNELKEGDRVEIYRAITADPKKVKRKDRADEDEDD